MDDRGFQQELHAINQRMTALSLQSSPIQPAMDPFTREVDEVNNILGSMEERLAKCKTHLTQSTDCGLPPTTGSIPCGNGAHILPSGPHFWTLYANMCRQAQDLERRVAALTSTVSELEDRIDSLDPKCLTPTSSADGSSDALAPGVDLQHALAFPFTEPPRRPKTPGSTVANSDRLARGPSLKEFKAVEQLREVHPPQIAACPFPTPPDAKIVIPTTNTYLSSGQVPDNNAPCPILWRPSGHEAQFAPQFTHLNTENEPESNPGYMMSWPPPPDRALPAWSRAIESIRHNGNTLRPPQNSTEGVAFRDREIARMDERLCTAQERLKDCEASMEKDQITIARLRSEREECRAVARKYRDKNHRLKGQVSQSQSKLNAQNARYQELESQLIARNNRVGDLEKALQNLRRSHESVEVQARVRNRQLADMEEQREKTRRDHDVSLKHLQELCNEKDQRIQQTVRVASRNTSLLAQRDHEINQLRNKIRLHEGEGSSARSSRVSVQTADDVPQQECLSRYIPDDDWNGDLIDTEERDYPENNATRNDSAQLTSSSALWIAATRRPYIDGSIAYGIDHPETQHTAASRNNDSEISSSESPNHDMKRNEARAGWPSSADPYRVGSGHSRSTLNNTAFDSSIPYAVPNWIASSPRRMASDSNLRLPPPYRDHVASEFRAPVPSPYFYTRRQYPQRMQSYVQSDDGNSGQSAGEA